MKRIITFFWVILLFVSGLVAQPIDLMKQLPVDPNVKIGKLSNGMVYYIRYNKMPEKRVEMRLVTNAGSILEDDDQQGLAHFTEHMCFNGTKHFSKSQLVDFLESAGVRFGADLNAYTSFDETVYMLQLPTDRKGLVDSAFLVLEDWAHAVSLEGEEIDKERGVIREERRLGLGADDRMRKAYFPVIFKDSRYANRIPIGQVEVIDTASYETLRRFYRDWYRPNLQAVIVVGDIDVKMVEKQIKSHFGKLKNPKNPPERKQYDVAKNKEPLVAIATDKEATNNMVMMFYKHDKKPTLTYADYKRDLMQNLYSSMLINRLNEYNQKPESPFIYAYTYYGGFMGRAMDAYASFAVAKENQIEKTLAVLVQENEKVRQFGFTATEFERQKTEMITSLQMQEKEKDKSNSSDFVREYTNNFLEKEPIPGIVNELSITELLLPTIKLEEVNAQAAKWITDENMVIVVTAPDREGVIVPDEATILKTIADAKKAKVEAYVDNVNAEPLLAAELTGSKIIAERKLEKNGITEIKLANNITVVLKPTEYKNDEILMTAFGPGGSSIFDDEQVYPATTMTRVVGVSGIGKFSNIELGKYLTGQIVSVQPFVDEVRQGLRGNASPKDFETLLQLTYLYFDGARHDDEAFEAFKSQTASQYKFMRSNPQVVFMEKLRKLASQNSKRTIVIPEDEQINALNADEIYGMYNKLFASADGYTFVFVGNFDQEKIKPLLAKYLGSLPVANKALSPRNVVPKFPAGITDEVVRKGTEHKSLVGILMQNDFDWNLRNRTELSLLIKAFAIKLRESMREDQGGVYGVGVRQNTEQFPESTYSIIINWGTNPEMVDTLTKTVFNEMQKLMANGPTPEDMVKIRETSIRERETSEQQNNFWNAMIDFAWFNNYDIMTVDEFHQLINSITAEDLKKAANRYFTPNHYLRVVLLPEENN